MLVRVLLVKQLELSLYKKNACTMGTSLYLKISVS